MSRTIYKYPLVVTDHQTIILPLSKFLHVELDPHGVPCLWAEVDSRNGLVNCLIHIVGTGNPIPNGAKHIGSFVQEPFVWHVYH